MLTLLIDNIRINTVKQQNNEVNKMENLTTIYNTAKSAKIDQFLALAKGAVINAVKATGRSSLYLQNAKNEEVTCFYDDVGDLIVPLYLNKVITCSEFANLLKADPFFENWIVKYVGDDLTLIEKED